MDPENPCLVAAETHDFAAMSRSELEIRREAVYPPFCRLVRLLFSHPDPERVEAEATRIGSLLSASLRHARVVGPAPCPLERVRGRHRWHLLLKGPKVQELMDGVLNYLRPPEDRDLHILADPDPQSLM
jgi:primosomal protein N' (replication factor Y)